ncbi:MAG TPA: histidine kinase dimerization/phospho-acceptor domain-containing protein [Terriglobales bacterium]|nr:histidine kinase dimerization/phospho-acceptor domain-containing protein [Terriglobales bacterium]
MNQPTVVIVSDDAQFSGAIPSRWQQERGAPAFTLVSGDLCSGLSPETFDLAIVGNVRSDLHSGAIKALEQSGKPVLLISSEILGVEAPPRFLSLHRHEGWVETTVLLASEVLRRAEALTRLRRAEQTNSVLERQAALGRYVIDMRHNLNNALTSILGNSELLLLDSNLFSAQSHSQVETIRNMALRMNEILQRFSSLEKELNVAARQIEVEPKVKSHAAAAW